MSASFTRARSSPRQLAGANSRRTGVGQVIPTPTQQTDANTAAAQQAPPAEATPPTANDVPASDEDADEAAQGPARIDEPPNERSAGRGRCADTDSQAQDA